MTEKYLYNPINKKENDIIVWMGFPGIYSFGMSSLGFLWMFKVLDECEDVSAERIFSDTQSTYYKVSEVDAFGFSFSFDFDFLEIFSILEKYNIPLKSDDRNEEYPLIFSGGPVVTANPEPYKNFFDFFIIGDGEDTNINAIRIIKENKDKSKDHVLELLSELEGVYVPRFPQKIKKVTKRLSECIYTPILSDEAFFKNTFIVELSRGCANRCGFCLASYLNLPIRSVSENSLFSAIELGLKNTNKIALLGAEVSAHPKFHEICNYITKLINNGNNIEMNFSSLRVDAVMPDVIKTLKLSGQKNLTLAIEAGSERLRRVINKNLSEEQVFDAVKVIKANGLKGIKFYGMIGIPTEADEDLASIVKLTKKLKSENKGIDISFGFSSFVPKPHTPFQWFGREKTKDLEKKSLFLQKELHKIGVQTSISSIKWDYWQAVLSRGDESLTDFLIEVYKQGGKLGALKSAAKKFSVDTDSLAYENFDFNKEFAWDFIEIQPTKDFLIKENKRLISYSGL